MKPDIIVCNPRDVLYPLWMWRMKKDKGLYGKLIVVMTQKATEWDFTSHIRAETGAEVITDYPYVGFDWRGEALTEALEHSTARWVLFLEQDFLMTDGFLQELFRQTHLLVGSFE